MTNDTEEDTADTKTVDTEEELSLESDTLEDLVLHDSAHVKMAAPTMQSIGIGSMRMMSLGRVI